MAEAADSRTKPGAANSAFVKELIKQWRAQDTMAPGTARAISICWSPTSSTRRSAGEMPIIGDPDPETLWRLELFYNAVGLADRARDRRHGVADDEDAPRGLRPHGADRAAG